VDLKAFRKALLGATLVDSGRKGKHTWWVLDRRPWPTFHFGMSGRFAVKGFEAPGYVRSNGKAGEAEGAWPPPYTKLEVVFADGTRFAYINVRRFGRVGLHGACLSVSVLSALSVCLSACLSACLIVCSG
jgi:formamidopyrimidine-DNA glycosylase